MDLLLAKQDQMMQQMQTKVSKVKAKQIKELVYQFLESS